MKNIFSILLVSGAAIFALAQSKHTVQVWVNGESTTIENADSITFNPAVKPAPATLSVSEASVESDKATVTVTPTPDTGSWFSSIYTATEAAALSDDQIVTALTAGEAQPKQGAQDVTFSDLAPNTEYTFVAFGWNGEEAGTVVRLNITTKDAQVEQLASSYFDVDYWGDVYHNGYDNFIVFFGDAPHNSVNIKGPGTIYTLSIYNKTVADATNPMPQEGVYTMTSAEEPSDFCIEPTESRRMIVTAFNADGTYTLKDAQLLDAKATITKISDDTWSLDVLITDPDGVKKEFSYTGKVNVNDRSFKGYTGPVVDHDIDFTADYTMGYNYVGTQFEIMDGGSPQAPGASWFDRNRLTIRLAADRDADNNPVPPVGTFEVSSIDAPGYVLRGDYVDLGGGADGPDGTYYYCYSKKDGYKQYYAFVQKGTVTISKDADNANVYTIKCDFTTEQGKKITATYTGTLPTTTAASIAPAETSKSLMRLPK